MSTLTVSQLNRQIRWWLEQDIGEVSVVGEISNLSKPVSGHYYFTLKDETAQVKCAYFRNYHQNDKHQFQNGQQVIAQGRLSLYEPRGEYQLIVQALTAYGLGELYRQFELLKAKLDQQGLFDQSRKKPIPSFPKAIAVITSSSGAALHDILTTLARRYPLTPVYVYASEVQGKTAAYQLINSLKQANQDNHCDVIILARGGGSIEDLWSFNDEQLALTISQSHIPVVTGIGHETDFTIADFIADLRAATPTAAAEAVTPNQSELLKLLSTLQARLIVSTNRLIEYYQMQLSQRLTQIASPHYLIQRHWQSLDYLRRQLLVSLHQRCQALHHQLAIISANLHAQNPLMSMQQKRLRADQYLQRLHLAWITQHERLKHQLKTCLATLHAVSPLATLDRGYAIATHQNKVLFSSETVVVGDKLKLQLAQGHLYCQVLEK